MKQFFVSVDGKVWSLVEAETAEKAALDFAECCAFECGSRTQVTVRDAGEGSLFIVKTDRRHEIHRDREPF